MLREIPCSQTESWYSQAVVLDGVPYLLRLAWAERERRWFLDLETADGTPVATGVKVVADRPLLQRLTSSLRPAGSLWCVDTTGLGYDPDLRDLGTRCRLVYVEAEDRA